MGLFDSWKQQPQQPQQPQGQQQPTGQNPSVSPQQPQQTNSGWAPPENQQQFQQNQQEQQQPSSNQESQQSPLDAFKDLWQTDPTKQQSAPSSLFSIDPKKISESVQKLNFAGTVNPELMQKAMSGDQQAFSQVLNQVSQGVFQQSFTLFHQMMEQGIAKNNSNFESKLPDLFRDFSSTEELSSDPLYSHPAARPFLEAVKKQLAEKYPERSAREIARSAQEFMQLLAAQTGGNKQTANQTSNSNGSNSRDLEMDFSNFLS